MLSLARILVFSSPKLVCLSLLAASRVYLSTDLLNYSEYPSFLGHASVNDIHLNILARSRNYIFLCECLGCCTIRFFTLIPCYTIATEEFACTFSCHDTWTITTKCSCTRNPFENRTEASLPFPLSFHVCVLNPCDNWDKKQMKFAQNL